jgi:hypothetical protein
MPLGRCPIITSEHTTAETRKGGQAALLHGHAAADRPRAGPMGDAATGFGAHSE